MAIFVAIILVSYTNAQETSKTFACTWFLYDDPAIASPACDYPTTLAAAKTQTNYRLLLVGENLAAKCPGTQVICAICVENGVIINGVTRPVISGDPIETYIESYFSIGGNNLSVVDFPTFIKEKQACAF